jgi:hypothetical protein
MIMERSRLTCKRGSGLGAGCDTVSLQLHEDAIPARKLLRPHPPIDPYSILANGMGDGEEHLSRPTARTTGRTRNSNTPPGAIRHGAHTTRCRPPQPDPPSASTAALAFGFA